MPASLPPPPVMPASLSPGNARPPLGEEGAGGAVPAIEAGEVKPEDEEEIQRWFEI